MISKKILVIAGLSSLLIGGVGIAGYILSSRSNLFTRITATETADVTEATNSGFACNGRCLGDGGCSCQNCAMKTEADDMISKALNDGKITQKQYEIITAMREIMPEMKGNRTDMSDVDLDTTLGEIQAKKHAEIISALKEKGIDVTEEELTELKDLRDELGLRQFGKGAGNRAGMGL